MTVQEKVEQLLLEEYKTVPFHNLFMLNRINKLGSSKGGTCSDKTLHFKMVLTQHDISTKLHTAFINNQACHRLLSIEIENKRYFIDIGSGWCCTKLLPAFKTVQFKAYGIEFKSTLDSNYLYTFIKTKDKFKPHIKIPLAEQSEQDILLDISHRYAPSKVYPFQNSLRFSLVKGNRFYFIKRDVLRIYEMNKPIIEKHLEQLEIARFIYELYPVKILG